MRLVLFFLFVFSFCYGNYTDLQIDDFQMCLKSEDELICRGSLVKKLPLNSIDDYEVGGNHICFLHKGEVRCDSSYAANKNIKVPKGIGEIKLISVAEKATCAISFEDKITCWGYDGYDLFKKVPKGLKHIEQIEGRVYSQCVTYEYGNKIHCWGEFDHEEVGLTEIINSPAHIAVGRKFVCLVHAKEKNDQIKCYSKDNRKVLENIPNSFGKIKKITAGWGEVCVLNHQNKVLCWGESELNILGKVYQKVTSFGLTNYALCLLINNKMDCTGYAGYKPIMISPGDQVTDILTLVEHTCAKVNQEYQCTGSYREGFEKVLNSPVGKTSFKKATGHNNLCVANVNRVYCYGDSKPVVQTPPWLKNPVDIAVGANYGCIINQSGKVLCWGQSSYNQREVPQELTRAQSIHGGKSFICAIDNKRKIHCWGRNQLGQTDIPELVRNSKVRRIFVGLYKACAELENFNIKCWGQYQQDFEDFLNFHRQQIKKVIFKNAFVCIHTKNKELKCLGSNQYGRLNIPKSVKRVEKVWMTEYFGCLISGKKELHCWGEESKNRRNILQLIL